MLRTQKKCEKLDPSSLGFFFTQIDDVDDDDGDEDEDDLNERVLIFRMDEQAQTDDLGVSFFTEIVERVCEM